MNFSLKFKILIGGLISAAFFVFAPVFIEATTICSFQGPDVSSDFLRLTDWSVSGVSGLKVGDTILVKFKLQNYGQYDLNLGSRGSFCCDQRSKQF